MSLFLYAIALTCCIAWWLTDRADRDEMPDPWEDDRGL